MKTRPGFTLVDLLVAMAILAIIFAAVYSVFAFQSKAVTAASENREIFGQGLMIMDRISRDIQGGWLPIKKTDFATTQFLFEGEKNELNLATTASLSQDETRGPAIVEVGYRLNQGDYDRPGKMVLIRRQDDTPDDDPKDGGSEIVLSRDVVSLDFYYVGQEAGEEESFKGELKTELPREVGVKLVLSIIEDQEETFITRVDLPLSWSKVTHIDMELPSLE